MEDFFIAVDPNELENNNANKIPQKELGNWLPDLPVGTEIYAVKLKYVVSEEYKRLLNTPK